MNTHIKSFALVMLITPIFVSNALDQSSYDVVLKDHRQLLSQQRPPSPVAKWISRKLGSIIPQRFASVPASPHFQKLWHEAQQAHGIAEQDRLPIVAFDEKTESKFSESIMPAAVTDINCMYVNSKDLEKKPYGFQRHALYHEAVHQKYLDVLTLFRDQLFAKYLQLMTCFGGVATSSVANMLRFAYLYKKHALTKQIVLRSFALMPVAGIVGYGAGLYLKPTLEQVDLKRKFTEFRADVTAAHALDCHHCVQDVISQTRKNGTANILLLDSMGYLVPEEYHAIAREYKRHGKVCEYHENQEKNPVRKPWLSRRVV